MAQLLLLNRDNFAPAGQDDERSYKLGDVIAVAEDGHVWGSAEQTHPFRVVLKPGPRSNYAYLLDPEQAPLRKTFTRSHFAIRRFLTTAPRTDISKDTQRPRQWKVDGTDRIVRKTRGIT